MIISFFLIGTTIGYYIYKNDKEVHLNVLKQHIGETFDTSILRDKFGNKIDIAFNTETAIVNFWFEGCTPCIETMEKYEELLLDNPNKITLISINIDNPDYWKNLLSEKSQFEFLRKDYKNWLHYCVRSDSLNSHDLLFEKYGIFQYPSYLIIDKKLKIIEVPFDPTWYVKSKYKFCPNYLLFIREQIIEFDKLRILTVFGIVAISIVFWSIVLIIWIGKKMVIKYRR